MVSSNSLTGESEVESIIRVGPTLGGERMSFCVKYKKSGIHYSRFLSTTTNDELGAFKKFMEQEKEERHEQG